ncbi:DUF4012 domain-containing protein [Candidatus Peribacteria bacterium]|nr:DUF4012 domain-containing protein [Candidatus Peribacteria bacterium]
MRQKHVVSGLILLLLGGVMLLQSQIPQWRALAEASVESALNAGTSAEAWQLAAYQAESLPSVYPFTLLSRTITDLSAVAAAYERLPSVANFSLTSQPFLYSDIEPYYQFSRTLRTTIASLQSRLGRLPRGIFTPEQQQELRLLEGQMKILSGWLKDAEEIYATLKEHRDRVLILFMNENEARAGGGFAGSLAYLDFAPGGVYLSFHDIYSEDRLLPESAKLPALDYFTPLDPLISLKDVPALSADFPTLAEQYQDFYKAMPRSFVPSTVLAVDTQAIRTLLGALPRAITLEPWEITVTPENADMVLQFLVESKIAGRYDVKSPIMQLGVQLMDPTLWRGFALGEENAAALLELLEQGHVRLWSERRVLQSLAERAGMTGQVTRSRNIDDFLQLSITNIGANKSDRFVDTAVHHRTKVLPTGLGKVYLTLRRTHTLAPGEIDHLLGTTRLSPNVASTLTDAVRYVLGDSQNRAIMHLSLPAGAVIDNYSNPSGSYNVLEDSPFSNAQTVEFPMHVSPGESLEVVLEYTVPLKRGSSAWRPYSFELLPTPARERSEFIKTITTTDDGQLTAETENMGRPLPLQEQIYRAVVEF